MISNGMALIGLKHYHSLNVAVVQGNIDKSVLLNCIQQLLIDQGVRPEDLNARISEEIEKAHVNTMRLVFENTFNKESANADAD
jgi:hypothetical protein